MYHDSQLSLYRFMPHHTLRNSRCNLVTHVQFSSSLHVLMSLTSSLYFLLTLFLLLYDRIHGGREQLLGMYVFMVQNTKNVTDLDVYISKMYKN